MTSSSWERIDSAHWRCRVLGCVLDVAKLERVQWGWTVCLDDHLIEAGMAGSLEKAMIDALLNCRTYLNSKAHIKMSETNLTA